MATRWSMPDLPVTIRDDAHPLEPSVHLQSLTNGEYRGTMQGNARLFIGSKQILPAQDGSFHAPSSLLKNEVIVNIPAGMQFTASKRGKKYYPVDSSQAASLAPQNRIYFKTAEEAEEAGFVK